MLDKKTLLHEGLRSIWASVENCKEFREVHEYDISDKYRDRAYTKASFLLDLDLITCDKYEWLCDIISSMTV